MITRITGMLNRVLEEEVRLQVGAFEYQVLVPEFVRRTVHREAARVEDDAGRIRYHCGRRRAIAAGCRLAERRLRICRRSTHAGCAERHSLGKREGALERSAVRIQPGIARPSTVRARSCHIFRTGLQLIRLRCEIHVDARLGEICGGAHFRDSDLFGQVVRVSRDSGAVQKFLELRDGKGRHNCRNCDHDH